jgi:serine O-acetyltransferase
MDVDRTRAKTLSGLVKQIVGSYHSDPRMHHLDATFLPNRERTIQVIELIRRLIFPGFFDQQRLTSETIEYHVGDLLNQVNELLYEQVREALRYDHLQEYGRGHDPSRPKRVKEPLRSEGAIDGQAHQITMQFLQRIPEIRRVLGLDMAAAFEGDPAASNTDETIFCYPGVDAIFIHRVAHELWELEVPLLPRMMSEYSHNETGIDIHPGATIGESFFIDHGTGVVIGETAVIGRRVKVYQGVTLGALSTKGGQAWRGRKRHPTIEDDVTIYAGAIILGGETTIGKGSVIGGSVFLTQSVPANHSVSMKPPELKVTARRSRDQGAAKGRGEDDPGVPEPYDAGL